jgi:hypothetical protein
VEAVRAPRPHREPEVQLGVRVHRDQGTRRSRVRSGRRRDRNRRAGAQPPRRPQRAM